MNAARYCFLLLALLFRKIANMRIFHSERSNHENTYTLVYFVQKLNHRKEGEIFHLFNARARSLILELLYSCKFYFQFTTLCY